MRGFTLIEFLIAMVLMIVLIGAAIPLYTGLQTSAQLNESADQLVQTMRLARSRAAERLNNAQHGVYLDIDPAEDDRYILFQGNSYATRDPSFDRITTLDDALALSSALSNGASEIVFNRTQGVPSATGTITLTHVTYGSRSLSVNSIGRAQRE